MLDHATSACHVRKAHEFAASEHRLLIGGQWRDARSGQTYQSVDPGNERVLATVAEAGIADVEAAVAAARTAFDGPWRQITPDERQRLLWKLADLLEANEAEFAALESLDNGKPFAEARALDVPGAVRTLRYCAGWATKLNGETVPVSHPGEWHSYTLREPVGVAGLILPWNAPLMMAAGKLGPALAAGCTVVMKPAEQTPLTALRLGRLACEAGFPDGVINILTGFGDPLGQAIVDHRGIDKISFTGSTAVGQRIIRSVAGDLKRVTLELGGKSPVIIMPDADIEKAAAAAARGIFGNAGQVCNAGSRLYVHRAAYDRVLDAIVAHAQKISVGYGLEDGHQMGPLISDKQRERVANYVEAGQRDGAALLSGGTRPDRAGYYYSPTVLGGTDVSMSVVQEEIFGPVLCAMRLADAEDLDAVAAQANETGYGLGASLWTRDLGIAHRLARRLRVGTVRINGGGLDPALPFGGFKMSGWGRDSGREGVESFTELKSVMLAL